MAISEQSVQGCLLTARLCFSQKPLKILNFIKPNRTRKLFILNVQCTAADQYVLYKMHPVVFSNHTKLEF